MCSCYGCRSGLGHGVRLQGKNEGRISQQKELLDLILKTWKKYPEFTLTELLHSVHKQEHHEVSDYMLRRALEKVV